eukprot:3680270-Lingulodinium_polyedra.AAC.1
MLGRAELHWSQAARRISQFLLYELSLAGEVEEAVPAISDGETDDEDRAGRAPPSAIGYAPRMQSLLRRQVAEGQRQPW